MNNGAASNTYYKLLIILVTIHLASIHHTPERGMISTRYTHSLYLVCYLQYVNKQTVPFIYNVSARHVTFLHLPLIPSMKSGCMFIEDNGRLMLMHSQSAYSRCTLIAVTDVQVQCSGYPSYSSNLVHIEIFVNFLQSAIIKAIHETIVT